MDSLIEFKKRVKNVSAPRKHKVRNSLGVGAAYLYVQSNKWFNIGHPIKESLFQQIIRGVNSQLALELAEGRNVVFPLNMGTLEVRKSDRFVRFNNGKIETNYRINWDKTLELWAEDKEAYNERKLIRDVDSKERYTIFYNRKTANYENKSYFQFRPNRGIIVTLGQNIKHGYIDAYSKYGNALC